MPGSGLSADDVLYGQLRAPNDADLMISTSPQVPEGVDASALDLQYYFTDADGFSGTESWSVRASLPESWLLHNHHREDIGRDFLDWRENVSDLVSEPIQFDDRDQDNYHRLDDNISQQRKMIEALTPGSSWRAVEMEEIGGYYALYLDAQGTILGQLTL